MKFTSIYLIINCFGDPNKVYIGKEKSHKELKRENDHKRTYGKQIEFTFIDQVEGWNKENWKPLESFYINYFKFLGFEVLNKNEGGNGVDFHTDETKLKLSISLKGKSKPKGFGDKISQILKGRPSRFKNHNHSEETKSKQSLAKLGKPNFNDHKIGIANSKPVFCIELNQTYSSTKIAAKLLNIGMESIRRSCDKGIKVKNLTFKKI